MSYLSHLNPYELHKHFINDYLLRRSGDTKLLYTRDTSKDRTDIDILRENHKFLWNDDEAPTLIDANTTCTDKNQQTTTSTGTAINTNWTWEQKFAKKYYDKLFKEYSICDLSRYKDNKVALRWRIEQEVIIGKGQFICANKRCEKRLELRSWEVNFSYAEHGQRKNALVKVRLCPDCSKKLNYHSKKREIKRCKKLSNKSKHFISDKKKYTSSLSKRCSIETIVENSVINDKLTKPLLNNIDDTTAVQIENKSNAQSEQEPWTKLPTVEEKSREDVFNEYLEDLLL